MTGAAHGKVMLFRGRVCAGLSPFDLSPTELGCLIMAIQFLGRWGMQGAASGDIFDFRIGGGMRVGMWVVVGGEGSDDGGRHWAGVRTCRVGFASKEVSRFVRVDVALRKAVFGCGVRGRWFWWDRGVLSVQIKVGGEGDVASGRWSWDVLVGVRCCGLVVYLGQIRGFPGDLSLGIAFPGDMSPGISGTEKLKWDSFPGDIAGPT
ncbi:hypothetical protein Tco_1258895 [Tanacetum coccineum]